MNTNVFLLNAHLTLQPTQNYYYILFEISII